MTMVAQDLLAWTAMLCLDGAIAKADPATLRYQLLHVATRIARRGRDLYLRIDETWPWRDQLDAAFGRLRAALFRASTRATCRPRTLAEAHQSSPAGNP